MVSLFDVSQKPHTKQSSTGIDLDWEYPGAPDRGGIPDDTKNYIALLETLRSTFDRAPRTLGISFTALLPTGTSSGLTYPG